MDQKRLTSQERKQEIIQAALGILHHQGVSQLTLRHLGEVIGISEAAVYRHFNSKEEVIQRLAESIFKEPGDRTSLATANDDPTQRLRQIMFRQLQVLETNPFITAVLFQDEIFREFPAVRQRFDTHRDAMVETIIAVVKDGQRRRVWRSAANPQVFAVIFIGTIRQLVSTWRAKQFPGSLCATAEPIFEELMRLLDKPQP